MITLNSYLNRFQFEGIHYVEGTPVYTGNLNNLPDGHASRLDDLCQQANIQLRYYDETITDDNGKVHEIYPEYHGQAPTYCWLADGIMAQDEVKEFIDDYAEHLTDNPHSADQWSTDFTSLGFKKFDYEAESGFHYGQNDTPKKLAELIQSKHDGAEIIFSINSTGQFDIHFSAWYRVR